MATGLMMLLPAIVLAVALIFWPHRGRELIARIAARRRPSRPRRARPLARRRRLTIARGGRLLATSLAARPPPGPLSAS
ncbi:MAG TPA: hypothetical protein VHV53_03430 [Solirubrobacterales bacterium]|jgi:hypothetical protein|nr:hypothetical protein [Solirubrobacterales bacterium]